MARQPNPDGAMTTPCRSRNPDRSSEHSAGHMVACLALVRRARSGTARSGTANPAWRTGTVHVPGA